MFLLRIRPPFETGQPPCLAASGPSHWAAASALLLLRLVQYSSVHHDTCRRMLPFTLASLLLLSLPELVLGVGVEGGEVQTRLDVDVPPPTSNSPLLLNDTRSLFVWGDSYSSNTWGARLRQTGNYTSDRSHSETTSGGDI